VSAWPEGRRAAPLASLIERAAAFLVEPADPSDRPGAGHPPLRLVADHGDPVERAVPYRGPLAPMVAVLALAPRAGASTIARALAGYLARVDGNGAAVLSTADPPRAGIAGRAAARLARDFADTGFEGFRAVGRACIAPAAEPLAELAAHRQEPLIADLGHSAPTEAAVALADHVVLVVPPDIEPALATTVEASLRADERSLSLVVNRALGDPPPELGHALVVPEARLPAQLASACRDPRGPLREVATELAERSLAEVIG
jgi:hypothetical protein